MDYNALRRGWVLCHGAAVYIGYGFVKPPACKCCCRPTRWLTAAEYEQAERRHMSGEKPVCIACGDTGKNSNGNPCWPCQNMGRLQVQVVKARTPLVDVQTDYKFSELASTPGSAANAAAPPGGADATKVGPAAAAAHADSPRHETDVLEKAVAGPPPPVIDIHDAMGDF